MITRRKFFAAAVAYKPPGAHRPINRDRVSAITDEIARNPAGAIDFLKSYGLRWAELREVPGRGGEYAFLPEGELRQAATEFKQNSIRVSFLDSSMLKFPLPGFERTRGETGGGMGAAMRAERNKERFRRRMEELNRALMAAEILGVDKVRIFTFSRVAEPLTILPRVAEILAEMAEVSGRRGIHLLVENENSCNVSTCAELAALMKLLPSPWVGINWDVLNGISHKETPYPDGYWLLPVGRIGNIHIKGRSVLPGPQRLDWATIFHALERDGYQGCVSLETHIFGPGQIQASHESMKEILRIVEAS
jgi:sugar phosphate isomerase/epimerase